MHDVIQRDLEFPNGHRISKHRAAIYSQQAITSTLLHPLDVESHLSKQALPFSPFSTAAHHRTTSQLWAGSHPLRHQHSHSQVSNIDGMQAQSKQHGGSLQFGLASRTVSYCRSLLCTSRTSRATTDPSPPNHPPTHHPSTKANRRPPQKPSQHLQTTSRPTSKYRPSPSPPRKSNHAASAKTRKPLEMTACCSVAAMTRRKTAREW